jgi:hypothetical protein
MFGEDPFIAGRAESPDHSAGFSAWDYAKARCDELCAQAAGPGILPGTPGIPAAERR